MERVELVLQSSKLILILMFLTTLGPIATDIYLPSMPAIANSFNVPLNIVQFSIAIYMLGYSIGALFHGTLSDRFGRKPVVLTCLSIAIIGGFICCLSSIINVFLLGRFIQGLGFSGTVVLSRTIIRDIAPNQTKLIQNASTLGMLNAAITALAPLVGGYVERYAFWQLNFIILIIAPLSLSLICWFKLPETKLHKIKRSLKEISNDCIEIVTNKKFVLYNMVTTLTLGCMVAYQTISADLLQLQVGLNPDEYGYTALMITLFLGSGGFFNSRAIAKYGRKNLYNLGSYLFILAGFLYVIVGCLNISNIYSILVPISILAFSSGIMLPNSSSGAMAMFGNKTGTASSLYTFFQMLGVSIISAIISNIHHPNTVVLGILFVLSGTLCIIANILIHGLYSNDSSVEQMQ
jgi:Bcr/CflA subfamily drug resistance transporter